MYFPLAPDGLNVHPAYVGDSLSTKQNPTKLSVEENQQKLKDFGIQLNLLKV